MSAPNSRSSRPPDPAGPRVAIRSAGEAGPHVVFLHGFGADRLSWAATDPGLPSARLHTLDLPGHGSAGPQVGDGSAQTLLAPLLGFIAGLDEPAHLVGHSLGGGLALMAAEAAPERVASLFLISPAGLGAGVDAGFLATLPEIADEAAMRAALERLVVRAETISAMTARYAFAQLDRPGARAALRAVATAFPASEARFSAAAASLASTPLPRHVVWGARDAINPEARDQLAAFAPHDLVPDAGHLPHIEASKAVNARLAAFLADLS